MPRKPRKSTPSGLAAIPLLAFQRAWLEDETRFKVGLKSRQIGFTLFCLTLGAVVNGLKDPGARWYYLSAGERQAREAIEDVQTHCRALNAAFETIEDEVKIDDRYWKALEVRMPGGSRIVGLPANPSTARGSRGNMILDEFAFHKDARAIWRAAFPIATHQNRKLWVASTPAGKSGKFYDLWMDQKNTRWARHEVDIHKAVADGLPVDIQELREGIGDDDDWKQEFECKFLDASLAWLPFELLDGCTSDDPEIASMELPEGFDPVGKELYKGIDIGRSKNLSVDTILQKVGDVFQQKQCKILDNVPYDDQEAEYNATMGWVRRCCIDKGLMGNVIHEHLERKWGKSRVEGVQFSSTVKEDLAVHLRAAYEDRRMRIPYDLDLRRDLHSVKRTVTVAGNVRFDPDKAESKKEHADRFWSEALAVHAGSTPAQEIAYTTVERMRTSELVDERREGRRSDRRRHRGGTGWREEV